MSPASLPLPFAGGCACGAVRYRCTAPPFVAYACHCTACRRMTASAFATCIQVPAEALVATAGVAADRTRTADSGAVVHTHFCAACGTALFSWSEARPRLRTLYVGALDAAERVTVRTHIWTDRALPWVVLPAEHVRFPRAGDWRAHYRDDPDRLRG